MAKKRGGIAGFFDRNKKWLAPVATGLAGLFNPALGAAVGGAIGGFDRPGKGGIGFDVGKGALGAASGYALGKGLQGAKGLFAAKSAIPGVTGAMPSVGITPGGAGALTRGLTAPALSSAAPSLTTAGGAVAQKSSLLGDLFSPKGIAGTAQGVMSGIQSGQANALARRRLEEDERQFGRTAALAEQRFAEEQRSAGVTERMAAEKFAEEQRLNKLDEERRRRVASLMALFAPRVLGSLGQAQGGAQGGAVG
jgi:hypothetical protein